MWFRKAKGATAECALRPFEEEAALALHREALQAEALCWGLCESIIAWNLLHAPGGANPTWRLHANAASGMLLPLVVCRWQATERVSALVVAAILVWAVSSLHKAFSSHLKQLQWEEHQQHLLPLLFLSQALTWGLVSL